jgi:hypothetical protein
MNARAALLVVALVAAVGCSDAEEGTAVSGDAQGGATTSSVPQVPAAYQGYSSDVYDDLASWLCHPAAAEDVCDGELGVTVVEEDGSIALRPWEPAEEPAIDCFYVYPTISRDPGPLSDMEASPDEEGFAALNQVALLGERCRVFAPVYRQRTLAALAAGLGGPPPAEDDPTRAVPFEDVTDAWRHYMATENDGRGVVLIGHSQGASILNRLIAAEIDPDPEVRALLVSAFLAGSGVVVPEGADVGGAFQEVPLCRRDDQTGCVVTWAAYRSDQPPPPDALFGRPRGSDGVVGCNNPAALDGGRVELDSRFPGSASASLLSSLGQDADAGGWIREGANAIDTPFVATPGLVVGECVERDGFRYLEVEVKPGPGPRADDIGGDLTPQWGLHLQDVNLVMGDISRLVGTQTKSWLAGRD